MSQEELNFSRLVISVVVGVVLGVDSRAGSRPRGEAGVGMPRTGRRMRERARKKMMKMGCCIFFFFFISFFVFALMVVEGGGCVMSVVEGVFSRLEGGK